VISLDDKVFDLLEKVYIELQNTKKEVKSANNNIAKLENEMKSAKNKIAK
jgi:hypothetical protein